MYIPQGRDALHTEKIYKQDMRPWGRGGGGRECKQPEPSNNRIQDSARLAPTGAASRPSLPHPQPWKLQGCYCSFIWPLCRILAGSAFYLHPPLQQQILEISLQAILAPQGCGVQASLTSQCSCTHIAVGIAIPLPVAGWGHSLPHIQL